jgi:hypothetical protein
MLQRPTPQHPPTTTTLPATASRHFPGAATPASSRSRRQHLGQPPSLRARARPTPARPCNSAGADRGKASTPLPTRPGTIATQQREGRQRPQRPRPARPRPSPDRARPAAATNSRAPAPAPHHTSSLPASPHSTTAPAPQRLADDAATNSRHAATQRRTTRDEQGSPAAADAARALPGDAHRRRRGEQGRERRRVAGEPGFRPCRSKGERRGGR